MRKSRAMLCLFVIAGCLAGLRNVSSADDGPGTLLQWGYGPHEDGGPDLSKPLVTDRPDFTQSPVTVGVGVLQYEGGYTFTYDATPQGHTSEHSYPESLFRIGMLAEWFELQLGWSYANSTETSLIADDENLAGARDLYIATKLALTPQHCCLPESGIILQMTAPTGSPDFTAGEVQAGVDYCYAWEVNDKVGIGGSTQANRVLDDDGEQFFVEFAQSITSDYKWTDNSSTYAEWFMFAPCGATTDHNEQYFDTGYCYLISNNIQWDIRVGVGLNQAANDFFAGSGIAIRMY